MSAQAKMQSETPGTSSQNVDFHTPKSKATYSLKTAIEKPLCQACRSALLKEQSSFSFGGKTVKATKML